MTFLLLLLSHWCDANDQRVVNCTWNTALTNNYLSINCTPTVIYKINGRFYITVCINLTSPYIISVLEVRLHLSGSVIENAMLFGPLTEIRISSSLSTLISFLWITMSTLLLVIVLSSWISWMQR